LELKVIRQNAISIIFLLYHQSIYVLNYLVYCFGVGHVVPGLRQHKYLKGGELVVARQHAASAGDFLVYLFGSLGVAT